MTKTGKNFADGLDEPGIVQQTKGVTTRPTDTAASNPLETTGDDSRSVGTPNPSETADLPAGDSTSDAAIDAPENDAAEVVEVVLDPASIGTPAVGSATPEVVLDLGAALTSLRSELQTVSFPLQIPHVDVHQAETQAIIHQLDDYIIPRVESVDAPLLAVVGGSTGAGKSTLVNSILGEKVTTPGVLRPTTRSPILVHHPDDKSWFVDQRILPGLNRVVDHSTDDNSEVAGQRGNDHGDITSLKLVPCSALPQGMALLDAPDIDSVVDANRELAAQLLAAADLWVFVTTANRYADAVPWKLLTEAGERGASVAMVLDRVHPDSVQDIKADLQRMLTEHQLDTAPLFSVAESELTDGMLPEHLVAPLAIWLKQLGEDAAARQAVARRTLEGALKKVYSRCEYVQTAITEQQGAVTDLRRSIDTSFDAGTETLQKALSDGTIMRGEVLTRWQEFVGTGEFFRGVQSFAGRVRDRLTSAVLGRPAPVEPLGEAVYTGLTSLIVAEAESAVERTVLRWQATPGGIALLDNNPEIRRVNADASDDAARLVREWQRSVYNLVREEGANRRIKARWLSFGVNAMGIVLMIVVFAGTAFITTGAEVAVGAGTAVVGQKLLEAIFGDQAVRSLAEKARDDLNNRVASYLKDERLRFTAVLNSLEIDEHAAARLGEAVDRVEAAR